MNTTVLEKIQSELERSGCDAFLLSGGDNMRYAAQVHLPFTDEHPGLAFVLFAKGRLPLVLSPSLWARSWERGIISDVRAYPGSLDATHAAAELAAFLRPLGLASIGLDMNRASVALRAAHGVSAAYVFAPEGVEPETDVHARLIDPDNAGEDPFTGSAAGCMASYMHAHGLCSGTRIRLEQGHILDRPGTGELELILASDSGKLDAVRLGGTAVSSASGTLRW